MSERLGIVIPSLNSAGMIGYTFESIRPLIEKGARVILVDSYSDDATKAIASRYTDLIIDVERGNMYRAINAGIEQLECEWVTYINSDDLLHPDAVHAMFEQYPEADVVYGNLDFIDDVGRFYGEWKTMSPARLGIGFAAGIMPMLQPGTVFKRDLWSKLNGFDSALKYSADFDFFLRAFSSGAQFRKVLNPPVASFRRHGAQFSQLKRSEMADEVRLSVENSGLRSRGLDRLRIFLWRLSNFPTYLMRYFRSKSLSGTYRVLRSI